jgi:exosortase/archaeosortase family protein
MRAAVVARIALFALLYLGSNAAYQTMRGSGLGRWLIDGLTVVPAATLIAMMFPTDGVIAYGPSLIWPGGRLQLLAGCDGFEVLALYGPAVLVAPVSWRRGLLMLASGSVLIWALNQLRLLALYGAFRHWHDAFDPLHTVWGPLAMVSLVFGHFAWNLWRDRQACAQPA